MKLYEIPWGLYPRRVSIYLAEKGICNVERVAFDVLSAWPPPELLRLNPAGTVPILQTEDGTLIRSSIAILEYLEERFPEPDMLGRTPEAAARTRELVSVVDEAASQFVIWCREGSALFAMRKRQSAEAASVASEAYYERLKLLDTLAQESKGQFLAGSRVSIADCIAIATLQFAQNFYGVPLPDDCPALSDWYASITLRPSAAVPEYPAPLQKLAYGLSDSYPPITQSHRPADNSSST